jgi:hypothetical protein
VPSELRRNPLEPPSLDGDDLEAAIERPTLGMSRKPCLGRSTQAPAFLRRHHLERMAVVVVRLALDLAEDDAAAAPDDQVELVAAGPDVGVEDAVAAQAIVTRGAAFEPIAGAPCIRLRRAQAAATGKGSSPR